MGLLADAANAWNCLYNIRYILDIGKKKKVTRIELSFLSEDFPHLAGMQYAKDVDFGLRPAEYYGERLVPALLEGKMDDSRIENSRNWLKISGRLNAIIHLQNTLDGEFQIVAFNKEKVRGYSQIFAKYAIRNTIDDEIYFLFLDERSGKYYCKSAFRKEDTDYFENQTQMTILEKTKIENGVANILFTKDGYSSEGNDSQIGGNSCGGAANEAS